jgi:hypothetical protein
MVNGKWLRVEGGREFLIEGEESKAGGTLLRPKAMEDCVRKRWVGKWVDPGQDGKMEGKRTGFSHMAPALTRLFPHVSTQVVDFPHKATARFFWSGDFTTETQSQEEERDRMDNDCRHHGRNGRARPIRRIRILVAIFATERSRMFA